MALFWDIGAAPRPDMSRFTDCCCANWRAAAAAVSAAVLTGCGLFMVQAVVSMQAAVTYEPTRRASGAGGFSVFAETTAPVKEETGQMLGLPHDTVVALRVRDGDDAGCLNLNRAAQPRIYGVDPDALASRNAFASEEEAPALWSLLKQPLEDGVCPVLVGDTDTALWGFKPGLTRSWERNFLIRMAMESLSDCEAWENCPCVFPCFMAVS